MEVMNRSGEDGECPPKKTSVRILALRDPARAIARAIVKTEKLAEVTRSRSVICVSVSPR